MRILSILTLLLLIYACEQPTSTEQESTDSQNQSSNKEASTASLVGQDYFCMTFATKGQTIKVLQRQRLLLENAVMDKSKEEGAFVAKLKKATDELLLFLGNGKKMSEDDLKMMQQICDKKIKLSNPSDDETWKFLLSGVRDEFYTYKTLIEDGAKNYIGRSPEYESSTKELNNINNLAVEEVQTANSYTRLLTVMDWKIKALNMEISFLDALLGKDQKLNYDRFAVFNLFESKTVRKGEKIKGTVRLGAYSSMVDYKVKINGEPLKVVDGIASYEKNAVSVGEKKYRVEVIVRNPLTGENESVQRIVTCNVVE